MTRLLLLKTALRFLYFAVVGLPKRPDIILWGKKGHYGFVNDLAGLQVTKPRQYPGYDPFK